MADIVKELRAGATISDVLRVQQSYHEQRRWGTDNLFDGRRLSRPAPGDKAALWHASRAELTTQPAGIRLAVDGVKLANEIRESNPLGPTSCTSPRPGRRATGWRRRRTTRSPSAGSWRWQGSIRSTRPR
ncbi:hypothetical protein ACLGIH_07385 [Streptomyces sp. HMX87]|uniref:hypothetical protein n=1 Tax=Streptomyces sp. HMX87 TaxID=3390849 RepID=UPI003A8BB6DB